MTFLKKLSAKIPWRAISYHGTIYLFMVVVLLILYPLTVPIFRPIVALVLPLDPRNSLLKMLLIYTLFYWGTVLFKAWRRQKNLQK